MTRTKLIERLEAAEGSSRELDAEVAQEMGWTKESHSALNVNGSSERFVYWRKPGLSNECHEHLLVERKSEITFGHYCPDDDLPPAFTSSIDAALTLVPEGWGWHVTKFWQKDGARVELSPNGFLQNGLTGTASTPALAICIAALKAQGTEDE